MPPGMPGGMVGSSSGPSTWISIDNLLANADVLGKISGNYTLSINSATVDQLLSLTNNATYKTLDASGHIGSLQINDTSANIAAHLDQLQGLGSKLNYVMPTDSGTTQWITTALRPKLHY